MENQPENKKGPWLIGSNEEMQQSHEELIETLKEMAEKYKINVDDVIEYLNNEHDLAKAYLILIEFISTVQSGVSATETKNK